MGFFGRFAVVAVVGIGVLLAVLYDMSRQKGLMRLQKQPSPTIAQKFKEASEEPRTTQTAKKKPPPQETKHLTDKQPAAAASIESDTNPKQNTSPQEAESTHPSQHRTASSRNLSIPTRHRVRRGETLAGIARKYFGDWRLWRVIAYVNNIKRVGDLRVGQEITIPALKVHKVEVGETLYSICLNHRRKCRLKSPLSELVMRVADMNGIEPSKLRAGQVIALPIE